MVVKSWRHWVGVVGAIMMLFWPWVAVGQTGAGNEAPRLRKPPTPDLVTDEEVVTAMQKGVDALLKLRKDGTWEKSGEYQEGIHAGGQTALVTYALLHAGKSMDDVRIKSGSGELQGAIKYLTAMTPKSTYAAGLQANALAMVPEKPEIKLALKRISGLLQQGTTVNGGYYYELTAPAQDGSAPYDNSNTQFGVLGMWACHDAKVEVPGKYWTTADKYWRDHQNADGGWGYRPKEGSKLSMSAAGVASLFLTNDILRATLTSRYKPDEAVARGLVYLGNNFDAEQCNLYTLYAMERIGLAGGIKHFGVKNWYQIGARRILNSQKPEGIFDMNLFQDSNPARSTAFALLFLARGRNPVAFNKLQYNGPWNLRFQDDAHLSEWMGRQFEKPINWQTVTMDVEADDWLDAPILLITGSTDPNFTAEEIDKLRDFVELGGLIFSTTNNQSAEFDAAMEKAMREVVRGRFPVRDMEKDHPIFKMHIPMEDLPKIRAVSNGVRELWVHSPDDMSATWQTRRTKSGPFWDFPANLYFYACGKAVLHQRKRSLVVAPSPTPPVRAMTVGRLKYEGNWDPEPGAWVRMTRLAQTKFKTELKVQTVTLDKLDPKVTRVVYVTGDAAWKLTDEEVGKLKAFTEAGGTLWTEALAGRAEFGNSIVELAKRLYPNLKFEVLPSDHSLLVGAFDDAGAITTSKYRNFTTLQYGKMETPKLMAVRKKGRIVLLFSPYDMQSGFLGTDTWGINGYGPDSAQELGRNILLYLRTDTE